jgi:hypothetical protein
VSRSDGRITLGGSGSGIFRLRRRIGLLADEYVEELFSAGGASGDPSGGE